MPASEARITANRANSLKSTGPTSPAGKSISRRNGLKHGMAGRGVVLPDADVAEVDRRHRALRSEMTPRTEMGEILVGQLATLSVRMEQSALQQLAATSERVRHAADRFDEDRVEAAEQLLSTLVDDPRRVLRRLKRTPEGVDALVLAWRDLRADLTREPWPAWDCHKMARMANLLGMKADDLRGSRLEAHNYAAWGNPSKLTPAEGAGLSTEDRRAWARGLVLERVDREIAGLEAHLETLDLEAFDLDRAGAADRALFDPSKEATLARRYESEARRGFFRALKEFRQVEAEVEGPLEVTHERPEPAQAEASLASCRDQAIEGPPGALDLQPPPLWPPSTTHSAARSPGGAILAVGKPAEGRPERDRR
jgi:hypothetical protein